MAAAQYRSPAEKPSEATAPKQAPSRAAPPRSPGPAAPTRATPKGAQPSRITAPASTAASSRKIPASAHTVTAAAGRWSCPVSRDCCFSLCRVLRMVCRAVMAVSSPAGACPALSLVRVRPL